MITEIRMLLCHSVVINVLDSKQTYTHIYINYLLNKMYCLHYVMNNILINSHLSFRMISLCDRTVFCCHMKQYLKKTCFSSQG